MILLTHSGSRQLSCIAYLRVSLNPAEDKTLLTVYSQNLARVLLIRLHKDKFELASCADINTGTPISLWCTTLAVFQYLCLMLLLRVLSFTMKMCWFWCTENLLMNTDTSRTPLCFTERSTTVQCALLLQLLRTFSKPWLDCWIVQNLKFVIFTFICRYNEL